MLLMSRDHRREYVQEAEEHRADEEREVHPLDTLMRHTSPTSAM